MLWHSTRKHYSTPDITRVLIKLRKSDTEWPVSVIVAREDFAVAVFKICLTKLNSGSPLLPYWILDPIFQTLFEQFKIIHRLLTAEIFAQVGRGPGILHLHADQKRRQLVDGG